MDHFGPVAVGYMNDWCGTKRIACPDCRERLVVPHDYAVSAFRHRQHDPIIAWEDVIVLAHAREKPILHPTVLADRHLLSRHEIAARRQRSS